MINSLVVKSNDLIEARYQLNLNEQKIILYAVSKLDRNKDHFNILKLNVKEFVELLGTQTDRYSEVREIIRELRKKEIVIHAKEGEIITGWLSSIQNKNGVIELEFSEKLIPYLLQLKERFTSYELKNILYLKNKYSIRIYELLKQYENMSTNTRKFELLELKKMLMLDENQYSRFYDFNRFVLKPSMEEINKFTDIDVNYERVTKGNKVIGIHYHINYQKTNYEYIEYINRNYNIKEFKEKSGLANENFNSEQIIELYTVASEKLAYEYETGEDMFEYIKLNYLHMMKNKTVRNRYAYLKKALDEDFAVARGQIKFNYKI